MTQMTKWARETGSRNLFNGRVNNRIVAVFIPLAAPPDYVNTSSAGRINTPRVNPNNTNTVVRLVHPVYDMDTYLFKVNVFTRQAK